MIVGREFIWLHFPKTAGTETEAILRRNFESDSSVVFDAIDPANVIWHHSIPLRQKHDPSFEVGGRKIISNIRRLPNWLLSRVHAGKFSLPHMVFTREMFVKGRFFRYDGEIVSADDIMRRYTTHPVTHWIRAENFLEDFKAAFGPYPSAR